jgi:NADPH2:quinone reductase
VIDAVGEGVDENRVGQRVWTYMAAFGNRWGTAAQWSVLPADRAMPLASEAPTSLGACLGVPALTAHHCLFADGPISGKTVLVAGGAGAVGHYAIELAKHAGAKVVSTVSGDAKAALAKQAGADLIVNYREDGAAERIRAQAGPVDRIIEVDLTGNLPLDLAVIRPGGEIVSYAAGADDPVLPVRACMGANLILRFVLLYGVPRETLSTAAELISELVAAGKLTSLVTQEFPLDQIAAAQDAVQAGATGKVLVIP